MLTIEQAAEIAARNGLTVDATFIVPDEDWWSEYYDRMVERLNKLEPVEDAELEQIVTSMRSEIDLRNHTPVNMAMLGSYFPKIRKQIIR